MSIERVIRIFHPIGQGALYSERFEKMDYALSIVYDCGVKDVNEKHKDFVRESFRNYKIIDYLFISHLDEDHISLVKTLKESVGCIRQVILPFIEKDDVTLRLNLSSVYDSPDVSSFWFSLNAAYNGNGGGEDESRYLFVLPEGSGDNNPLNTRRAALGYSGRRIDSFSFDSVTEDWVFIPFCRKPKRRSQLDKRLKDLLADRDFMTEVNELNLQCDSLDDLKQLLVSDSFADMVDNPIVKEKLQDAYKGIRGSINQNSLIVYSGPSAESKEYRISRLHYFPLLRTFHHCYEYWHRHKGYVCRRVACLYTGDSDLDMKYYKTVLGDKWENVGTIQLPHHGSRRSFQFPNNENEFDRSYLFPVSFGITNSYGHPSGGVLTCLLNNSCVPILVNEDSSTRFVEFIHV